MFNAAGLRRGLRVAGFDAKAEPPSQASARPGPTRGGVAGLSYSGTPGLAGCHWQSGRLLSEETNDYARSAILAAVVVFRSVHVGSQPASAQLDPGARIRAPTLAILERGIGLSLDGDSLRYTNSKDTE